MKKCPYCAEQIQEDAIKCRFCGSMLNAPPGAPGAAAALASPQGAPQAPGAPSARDVAAVPLYEGNPSWKSQFWQHVGAVLLVLGGIAAVGVLRSQTTYGWTTSLIVGAALLVVGAVWLGYLALVRAGLHYRITTRTIDIEAGLLSKKIDTLQLWKVRDIEFNQSIMDRILNTARIRVFAHDPTTPEVLLWGLPESRELFDRLKNSIELARQARNVIGVVE